MLKSLSMQRIFSRRAAGSDVTVCTLATLGAIPADGVSRFDFLNYALTKQAVILPYLQVGRLLNMVLSWRILRKPPGTRLRLPI